MLSALKARFRPMFGRRAEVEALRRQVARLAADLKHLDAELLGYRIANDHRVSDTRDKLAVTARVVSDMGADLYPDSVMFGGVPAESVALKGLRIVGRDE